MSSFTNNNASPKESIVATAGESGEVLTPTLQITNDDSAAPPLALPNPSDSTNPNPISLTVGGAKHDFAELGPIIIQSDGSTRRITNWDQMNQKEQDVTWKRIAARNKKRIEELKAKLAEEGNTDELISAATEELVKDNQDNSGNP